MRKRGLIEMNSVKGSAVAWLTIGIIVAAVIIVAVLLLTPSGNEGGTGATDTGTSATTSPKEVYLEYKKEFDAAQNFDSYVAVVKKYGTASQIEKIKQSESLSAELKATVFSLAKSLAPTYSNLDINNIQESVSGNTATLLIDTKDDKMKGTITMLKENNVWKLEQDSWTNK